MPPPNPGTPAIRAEPPAPEPRLGWPRLLNLCLIMFGISVTESISLQVLPLTLRHFTSDAGLIGLILAINPFFGFIVQPLVGIWSDRIWTRFGRRAVFLLIGAPIVATCLVVIPFLQVFWHLVVFIVIYQLFQDVLYGSDNPLIADLVPVKQRALTQGLVIIMTQVAAVVVVRFGLPWIHAFEQLHGPKLYAAPVYWGAATLQVVLVAGGALFLGEKKFTPVSRPPLTLAQYYRDFTANPIFVRLAAVNFIRAFQLAAANGFLVLFATQTLAVPKDRYGETVGWLPVVGMVSAWLAGWIGIRWSRPILLLTGFAGSLGAYLGAFSADTLAVLAIALVVGQFSQSFIEVTFKAFVTEFLPRELIGQLTGAMNVCWATGRTLGYVVVGQLVAAFDNNYRLTWLAAIAAALVNLLLLASLRDPLHPSGKAAPPPAVDSH